MEAVRITTNDMDRIREHHRLMEELTRSERIQMSNPNPSLESDPTGKKSSDPGAKLDDGKEIAGELIFGFPNALSEMVAVATYGAKKYSRGGYLHVSNAEVRYMDAALRHLLKHGKGEAIDPESGLPHLSHSLWNIAAIIELRCRNEEKASSQSVR